MSSLRKAAGSGVSGLGGVLYLLVGLAGIVINLSVIVEATGFGFFAVVLGIFVFPVTLIAAPWYALIAWGNPIPLAVTYGGFILVVVFTGLGGLISGEG